MAVHDAQGRFAPNADLADKKNYSRHVFIHPDGGLSEAVRLNVLDDRHREDIIGFHFSNQYAKDHYGQQFDQPQFYVVSRDNPWDFEYVLDDGTGFFLEICRIADQALLRAIRAENDVAKLLVKAELSGSEIRKVEKHFPGTLPEDLVELAKYEKHRKFPMANNYLGPRLFFRPPMNPHIDLMQEIKVALEKKAQKKHDGKRETIIVLDNLTTHSSPSDFFDAFEGLSDFLRDLPFKSIWVYTGYYSDDDGYNSEFSMIPVWLPCRT